MNKAIFSLCLLLLTGLSVSAQAPKNIKGVYQHWLDEDVIYLIAPEERLTFLALNTDEEREHFIEQFWRRRDPNPQTEENEFREQYYLRIAHANMTFGFGKTAGWKTDRGRIYIIYGAPDEVEQQGLAETWQYHYRPVFRGDAKFQFVDLNRTGEFRLRQ